MNEEKTELEYAGFWIRFGASLADSAIFLALSYPLLMFIYEQSLTEFLFLDTRFIKGFWDLVISYILPSIVVIWFWLEYKATPGKLMLNITVVDEKTGKRLTLGQSFIRCLGYYISFIPFFLGFIWIGFDRRKQGWHDKMCGSVVIRTHVKTEKVKFY